MKNNETDNNNGIVFMSQNQLSLWDTSNKIIPEKKNLILLDSSCNQEEKELGFKELRDYQKRVVADVYNWYAQKKNSVMVYSPTGAGKTVISAKMIADTIERGGKVLFVVHRIPLLEQTVATVGKILGYIPTCTIFQGSNTRIVENADIIVGMEQSLKENKLPENIDLVVFDEVHTTAYYKIVRAIKNKYQPIPCLATTKFLGLTATPWRTRAKDTFCWLFEAVVKSPEIAELVAMGYLTPPRMFGYNGLIDYTKAEVNNGDFTQKFLNVVCNESLNTEVVDKYLEFGEGKQAIAFCASVKQAENLTKQFLKQSVPSELWVGSTDEINRKRIQKAFRIKQIRVIVSVSCLCEGFDEPIAEVALIARPTKSLALFFQMIGRVLRLYPDKQTAKILDFCDNFDRLGDPMQDIKIALCSREERKYENEAPTKICPQCGNVVPIQTRICPDCGFEFPLQKQTPEFNGENFGEILVPQQKEQFAYLRKQIRRIYSRLSKHFMDDKKRNPNKMNPVRAKFLFQQKYGYFPPREWYQGAIFSGSEEMYHKNLYRTYLEWLFPNKMDFFYEEIMQHEFGKKVVKKIFKNPELYLIPTSSNWHTVLGLAKTATRQDFKERYKELALKHHPDVMQNNPEATTIMQNINIAWDYCKQHFDNK